MTAAVPWLCHARPAALGRTCGHVNTTGMLYGLRRLLCCESCGATKKASDDRLAAKVGAVAS